MSAKFHILVDGIRDHLVHFSGLLVLMIFQSATKRVLKLNNTIKEENEKMEKAYDVKVLLTKFKGHGLELAEEEAKQIIGSVCEWLEESGKLSATPFDDMAFAAALPKIKELALGLADKINPADNA